MGFRGSIYETSYGILENMLDSDNSFMNYLSYFYGFFFHLPISLICYDSMGPNFYGNNRFNR